VNISIILAVLTLQNKQQQGGLNEKMAQITGKYVKVELLRSLRFYSVVINLEMIANQFLQFCSLNH